MVSRRTLDLKHFLSIVATVCLISGASNCNAEYGPPAVLNCSSDVISVTISRTDGKVIRALINPSAALLQPVRDCYVTSINSVTRHYGPERLSDVRRQHSILKELWIVLPKGIELVDFGELRDRRRQCK